MNDSKLFTRGILLGLAGVVGLMAGNAVLSYQNIQQLNEDAYWVVHTHEVLDALEELQINLRQTEVIERTYLITGGAKPTAALTENIEAARRTIGQLQVLTTDNAEQRARLPELEMRLDALVQAWRRVVSVRAEQGFDAAREIILAGQNDKTWNELQALIRKMDADERVLLRTRQQQTDRTHAEAVVTGIVTFSLGLVAVVMFIWLLERHLRSRERAATLVYEQQQLLQATLTSIGDGVIATNADGRVTFLNDVAQRLTGWTPSAAAGKPLAEVFHIVNEEARKTAENPALRALAVGKIVGLANHTVLIAKDGTEWPLDDSAAPIRDQGGAVTGVVLVFREVSERRRLDTERQRAEEALREADRRKDEFLATLAHELRNPLAPIRNGLQVMRMAGDNKGAVEQVRSMMDRQLSQLVRLVDDLMDVSRISRGMIELRRQRVELAAVIHSAVETSRPLIDKMEHQLTVALSKVPIILDADPARLSQVFLNLLNNSAKYTEPEGRIWLTAERQGSDVVVSVKDTGMGIAADQLPRVFTMFSQLNQSAAQSQGGLGIGLTLVKRLVEMHGGSIEAKSAGPGQGAEFVVRLPVITEASVPSAGEANNEVAVVMTSLRILVVDDNRDGADSLSIMLRIMGNDTRTAYDGEEAVAAAAEFRPRVILLDIGLPKLSGYEACQRIRAQPGGASIFIVAQTGWGQVEDRRRAREAGFDHHMVKPVNTPVLLKMLAGLADAANK